MGTNPIDRYLKDIPEPQKSTLTRLRGLITEIVPNCTECKSYGMPAFKYHGIVIGGFAARKNYCSYYPFSGSTLKTIATHVAKFEQTKSALHFPVDKPLSKKILKLLIFTRLNEICRSSDM